MQFIIKLFIISNFVIYGSTMLFLWRKNFGIVKVVHHGQDLPQNWNVTGYVSGMSRGKLLQQAWSFTTSSLQFIADFKTVIVGADSSGMSSCELESPLLNFQEFGKLVDIGLAS